MKKKDEARVALGRECGRVRPTGSPSLAPFGWSLCLVSAEAETGTVTRISQTSSRAQLQPNKHQQPFDFKKWRHSLHLMQFKFKFKQHYAADTSRTPVIQP